MTTTTYVNIYDVTQNYGGPEEGGWYYNDGVPFDCYRFDDDKSAREFMWGGLDSVLDELNIGRYSLGSSRSSGYYVAHLEKKLPKPFPSERPYYS